MSRIYKEEIVTKTVKTLVEKRCEICKESFVSDDVEIEMMVHTGYPGCGEIKTTTLDMCNDCFTGDFKKWVESKGGSFDEKTEDIG